MTVLFFLNVGQYLYQLHMTCDSLLQEGRTLIGPNEALCRQDIGESKLLSPGASILVGPK